MLLRLGILSTSTSSTLTDFVLGESLLDSNIIKVDIVGENITAWAISKSSLTPSYPSATWLDVNPTEFSLL